MTRFLFALLAALMLSAALTGCGGENSSGGTTGTSDGGSNNQLVIISPHTSEIQDEFERAFKAKNPNARLRWLDSGGSSDDLRFVQAQFAKKQDKDQGINIDVFFGGGLESFIELEEDELLRPLPSDYGVPVTLNGVPLRGKDDVWVAAALSGFGILYNKTLATRDNLPVPQTWGDLGTPALRNRIKLADPRHSGSAHAAYEIILQTIGWQRGWEALTSMTGNASRFERASTDLLRDVSNGEAVMVPAIDFYARSSIAQSGEDKMGYVEPRGQRVVTPDPIGILRGAPNQEMARAFVQFVMSPEGQRLWMLEKGAPGGPVQNALFRQAALPSLYKTLSPHSLVKSNPYAGRNDRSYDAAKATVRRRALDDLIGAVLIDNHDLIKARWAKNPNLAQFTFVPVSEDELTKLAAKWNDTALRQNTVSKWRQAARQHFQQ